MVWTWSQCSATNKTGSQSFMSSSPIGKTVALKFIIGSQQTGSAPTEVNRGNDDIVLNYAIFSINKNEKSGYHYA
jgi:hypothetical protein